MPCCWLLGDMLRMPLAQHNRDLDSNPAVSGPIPEQLSVLSLLTYLYIPPLLPKAAPKQALRGAQDTSLLVHQHRLFWRGDCALAGACACLCAKAACAVQEPEYHEPERHTAAAALEPQGA